jgi:hypothetical protein
LVGEEAAQVVGVVAAIGDEAADRSRPLQQGPGDADVVDVAGGQQQDAGPAQAIA